MSVDLLRALRAQAGLSQAQVAERVGISRQAYLAIESGGTRPSVDIALRLARTLSSSVEALFGLPLDAEDLAVAQLGGPPPVGQSFPVRVADVSGRRVAFPTRKLGGRSIAAADGLAVAEAGGRARATYFQGRPHAADLVVVGCDPAFGLVVDALRRERGVEVLWVQAGSRAALEALARGEAHVGGVHLLDPETERYNAPWVERLVPAPCTLVRFATWEESLLLPAGNPLGVRGVEDLTQPSLRFVNREAGSGSRALLDRTLDALGVSGTDIQGYESTRAGGHLEVAAAIAAGAADAGIGIRAAGKLYGLDALALAEAPYDLVVPDALLDLPAVQALVDLLGATALRSQVGALGGYDTSGMGQTA